MSTSTKRERADETNSTNKKIKSAKDVSDDAKIRADVPEQKVDDQGAFYWDLSTKRRVTLSNFKGAKLVSFREFYDSKDGKTLPGKQGIALNLNQFAALLKAIPAIKAALAEQGVEFESDNEPETVSDDVAEDISKAEKEE